MKWFYNLKIGAKLIFSFVLVALIAAVVGIVGIINLNQIEKSDTELYENMTVPIALLSDISTDFQRIRVNLRDMIIAEEIEEINSKMDRVNELRTGIDEKATEYEKLILSEAMRTAYDEFLQTRKNFSDQITVVYNLAKDNKDNEALGIAAEDGAMGIASRAEQDAIAKLVEMKINDAQTKATHNTDSANKAMLIMIIIVAVAILLAIAIGLFLTKVITKPMKLLIGAADKLSVGDINVNVKSESKDETGMLLDAFAKMIANIEEQAKTAELISVGNFGMNITPKSSNDVLNNSMKKMKETLVDLVAEVNSLTKAGADGKLDIRGNLSKFAGGYKDIIAGINNTLDAVIGPLNVAAEYVDRISKGDIPPKITDTYNGDFNEIKNNLNVCIDAVNALVSDADMLSQAAIAGKLDTRADANKHYGDFRNIVTGVNGTLDAVIGPLNVAAEYVDRISKGDIPPKITDTYNGDFNEIKNNLNVCIDAVNALVSDANMLAQAAIAGKLDTRADANKHYGDFRNIVTGVNGTLDAVIGPLNVAAEYVDRISKGDIPPKITDTYNGDFNEIKNNLNVCIDAVNALVSDADMLSQAAIAGKLDTRADANKHYGDFRNIVTGVNGTLDAVILPVKEAAKVLTMMANGNLKARVTGDYKGDHAEIKNALNSTLDSIGSVIQEITYILNEMANSNLDVKTKIEYKGDFEEIKEALDLIIESLNDVLGDVNAATDQVASGARQLSNSSMSLSQGATEQASSIEELTASIEEISAQTNQNAENANKAKTIAETAKSNAVQGNTQMQGMLKAMSDINESSNNISKIIKVIDEIAFQTNILALNAAVEAARAGKHGKGFAVVAEEVRNLAARSANAAKETTGMIEDSILKVADGTKIANETANALTSIVSGVSEAANLVSDIAVASNEQAIGVEQVNQGLMQISDVVQTTSATSEETAAASEELSGQAEMLKSKVMNFNLKRQKNETKFVESEKRDLFSSTTSKKNKSTKTILLGDDFKKY